MTKFRYLVYNPCVDSVDVAKDWGGDMFDTTQDIAVALTQPFTIAAVSVMFDQPHVFNYNPTIKDIDLTKFDLVLLSDIEYSKQKDIEFWARQRGIKNYLIALGGINSHTQLDPTCMLYRPYWIHRYLEKNTLANTYADNKPFMFDCLLGARRPHRDYIMLALTKSGLINTSIVTYRNVFPGAIVNEQSAIIANLFDGTSLNWPYVSPNLDSTWEVADTINNQVSFDSPSAIFAQTHYSIIAETLGTGDDFFLSEKTIKAMYASRVFVVFGPRHYLKRLHELGFQTFGHVIDESYDDEPVDSVRYQKAMLQVMRLAWFEDPKNIYSNCDFALINNLRVLPYLHQNAQEEMYRLLRAHTPVKCWL
jgi:hypothetical protein